MEWVEVTGKTVDEARERALDLLGVAEDDAEIDVLAEAKMGLFGRVREEARVRARLQPTVPRSKEDGARKRRPPARTAKEAPPAGLSGPTERETQGPSGPAERGTRGPSGPAERERQTPRPAPAAPQRSRARVAVADDEAKEPTMESTMSEDRAEVPVAEQAEVAREFVAGLLDIMGLQEATAEVVLLAEDTAELQVTGQDLGLLIGPKGATLLALQDLARTVVQRKTGARTGRLLLDVAGYRQKRKEALERFTQKVAQEVLASGAPAALEPMSSADRKIVHDTANGIEGVTTTSEGEDPRRRVVVRPG